MREKSFYHMIFACLIDGLKAANEQQPEALGDLSETEVLEIVNGVDEMLTDEVKPIWREVVTAEMRRSR